MRMWVVADLVVGAAAGWLIYGAVLGIHHLTHQPPVPDWLPNYREHLQYVHWRAGWFSGGLTLMVVGASRIIRVCWSDL